MKRGKMETAIAVRKELHLHYTEHQHQHEECRRSKEKKVFTLETYLDFLHTRNLQNLTVDHLNKIVSIHGYRKTTNRKNAEEAVGAITDLMHPARSTLKGSPPSAASGKAAVTLTEAVKDLKQLNWQECSVTSIRRISPKNYSIPDDDIPLEEVAEKLMSLRGIKRRKLSAAVARSTTGKGRGLRKRGPGSGGSSSAKIPDFAVTRKSRSKRVYLQKIHHSDHAITALTATRAHSN